jgi:hypothetical protein
MCKWYPTKCSKLTTVSHAPPTFLSMIFWIQRLSVIRLIFHKWRLIFALARVDDPTPHQTRKVGITSIYFILAVRL